MDKDSRDLRGFRFLNSMKISSFGLPARIILNTPLIFLITLFFYKPISAAPGVIL